MITGQQPQTPRVNLLAIEQSVFHREVRDLWRGLGASDWMEVGVVPLASALVQRNETRIGGCFIKLLLRHSAEQLDRIVVRFLPERGIQTAKQRADRVIPTP